MSSHHIVKDKQEPALIIANGESCSAELLGQLLEWSPTVVVLDGAAHRVQELGIKMDVIIGDFDRISPEELNKLSVEQDPLRIIHVEEQESTDLEKAIRFLIEEGYPAVNIVWATGRRTDHTLNNLMSLHRFAHQIDLVMYDDFSKIIPLTKPYEKWYPANYNLSLLPLGKVEGLVTTGLKYNLNNEHLESGIRSGSSNQTLQDGFVKISFQKGKLLLMECHD